VRPRESRITPHYVKFAEVFTKNKTGGLNISDTRP
jgi:hypothetical protein